MAHSDEPRMASGSHWVESMNIARLHRIDPDDPRWSPPPIRIPDVFMSTRKGQTPIQRIQGRLVAFDWTVDGITETLRPQEPYAPDLELIATGDADTVRFEIHTPVPPRWITASRVFDLGASDPQDFDSIAAWRPFGNSKPEDLDLIRVESGDTRIHWRLDVPLVTTRELSHITIQAHWLERPTGLDPERMAVWVMGLSGDPNGQTQTERIEIRDRKRDERGTKPPPVGDGGPIRWNPYVDRNDPDEKAAEMMRSPLGRALVTIAAESGMTAEELTAPETSVWLCAAASDDVEVWRGDRDQILAHLDREAKNHEAFLHQMLAQPSTSWWFAPMDREEQIWISEDGSPPSEDSLITPSEPSTRWERYALKPVGGLFTSTMTEGISPMLAVIDLGVGDLRPAFGEPPYRMWRMEVDPSARIFEIHGPNDWHRLCVEYPAEGNSGRAAGNEPDFSRDPGKLVPDWSQVAREWDAVHLSFGGYLTSEQVRIESEHGWTYHWAWDHERTLWLRWMFSGYERLADYREGNSVMPDFNSRLFFAAMNAAELSR